MIRRPKRAILEDGPAGRERVLRDFRMEAISEAIYQL
jgi:hypothetical protein